MVKKYHRSLRRRVVDLPVTQEFLDGRTGVALSGGYPKQKWVEFCEAMLAQGFTMTLYEARQTFSKYITVRHQGRQFKVRFSNHKPIRSRQFSNDCDFWVGFHHEGWSKTEDAVVATKAHLAPSEK